MTADAAPSTADELTAPSVTVESEELVVSVESAAAATATTFDCCPTCALAMPVIPRTAAPLITMSPEATATLVKRDLIFIVLVSFVEAPGVPGLALHSRA